MKKRTSKLLSALLVLVMVFTMLPTVAFADVSDIKGSGTEADPWVVYSWEDLKFCLNMPKNSADGTEIHVKLGRNLIGLIGPGEINVDPETGHGATSEKYVLDLNGKLISVVSNNADQLFTVKDSIKFDIEDSVGGGGIKDESNKNHIFYVKEEGVLSIYGGEFETNSDDVIRVEKYWDEGWLYKTQHMPGYAYIYGGSFTGRKQAVFAAKDTDSSGWNWNGRLVIYGGTFANTSTNSADAVIYSADPVFIKDPSVIIKRATKGQLIYGDEGNSLASLACLFDGTSVFADGNKVAGIKSFAQFQFIYSSYTTYTKYGDELTKEEAKKINLVGTRLYFDENYYNIEVEDVDLGTAEPGYNPDDYKQSITITNNGIQDPTITVVRAENTSDFVVVPDVEELTLGDGQTTTKLSIKPAANLAPGEHEKKIIVRYYDVNNKYYNSYATVKFTVEAPKTITFNVVNGTWGNGTTSYSIKVAKGTALNAGHMPSQRYSNEGYGNGSWSPTEPAIGTVVNEDMEFTYTFEKLPETEYKTVTFNIVNGTWANGSTASFKRSVETGTMLNAGNSPTGMKANEGYGNGSWSPTAPAIGTVVNEDMEFTYTFEKLPETEYKTVTFNIVNGTWANGSTASFNRSVETGTMLNAGNSPTGMKANEGYGSGSWSPTNPRGVTVNEDMEFTYTFEPIGSEVVSIAITKAPDKTSYYGGESFDPTGMVVIANYSDNSTKDVTDLVIIADGDNLFNNQTKVTVRYTENVANGNKTVIADQPITVTPAYIIDVNNGKATNTTGTEVTKAEKDTVITITANAAPEGKEFDKWEVNNGSVTLEDADAEETTFTMPGEAVEVTALYKDKTVEPKVIDKIEITGVVEPVVGEETEFDFTILADADYKEYGDCSWIKTDVMPGSYANAAEWETFIQNNATGKAFSYNGTTMTYEEGAYYSITIPVQLKDEGYKWADTVKVTINGHTGEFHPNAGPLADNVSCTFGPLEKPAPTEYTITFDANGGTVTPANAKTTDGKLTSLPTPTRSGYTFNGWFDAATGGSKVDTDKVYTEDTTIYAQWTKKSSGGSGSGGSVTTTYAIVVENASNGSVKSDKTSAAKGATVTLTVKADEGYALDTLKVTDANGKAIATTEKNGKYTFTMPASKVTVKGSFKVNNPNTGVANPFTDVSTSDWFYDDAMYAYENGLMNGTSTSTFGPVISTTRGMIVTILYRMEGQPAAGTCPFDDVKSGSYYENAIAWAAANGIVKGYGEGKFGPDDNITREQMAAILCRYAEYKGYDTSAKADLNKFSDAASISGYAVASMQWACGEGLFNGISDSLVSPQSNATRAQVAAILHRFCENVAK